MKNVYRLFFIAAFLFLSFVVTAQENEIEIALTPPVTIPPGADYALLRDITETGGQRVLKKDGDAVPGETLFLDIRIKNSGSSTVSGLWAELTSADPRIGRYIFLEKTKVSIGSLAAGASLTLTAGSGGAELLRRDNLDNAFRFSLDKACSASPVEFEIIFGDSSGNKWTQSLSVPVNKAEGSDTGVLGYFSFHVTNKIIERKSNLEIGVDWDYGASRFSGGVLYNRNIASATSLQWDLPDSLTAYEGEIHGISLIPVRYDFLRRPAYRAWAGIGAYYHDEAANYKGFFDAPVLAPDQTLNHFRSAVTYRLAGPHIDFGFTYRGSDWFKASLSGGIVPVFALWRTHSIEYDPLMASDPFNRSQTNIGGPNLHLDLSGIISLPGFFSREEGEPLSPSNWKLWYSFLFSMWRLPNESVAPRGVPGNWSWDITNMSMLTLDFTVEGAILVPIGGIYLQIGGGRIFGITYMDSERRGNEGANFITISGRMLKF